MININDFDPNLLKINKKKYTNIDIYYIGYITVKDSKYVNIPTVNPLYLVIGEADGSIEYSSTEEQNVNKYLLLQIQIKTKKY